MLQGITESKLTANTLLKSLTLADILGSVRNRELTIKIRDMKKVIKQEEIWL